MTRPLPVGAILKVAGVAHRQDVVRTMKVGDPVTIAHDPTNGADVNACAIATADGKLLGFVPRAGGLAERMAGSTPNGRWAGRVDEVLAGETWGLRVKLGPLVATAAPARPGDTVAGRREVADLVADDGSPIVDDNAGPAPDRLAGASPETPPQRVEARSGRLLGELVSIDGDKVRVRAADGRERSYRTAIVRIVEA